MAPTVKVSTIFHSPLRIFRLLEFGIIFFSLIFQKTIPLLKSALRVQNLEGTYSSCQNLFVTFFESTFILNPKVHTVEPIRGRDLTMWSIVLYYNVLLKHDEKLLQPF